MVMILQNCEHKLYAKGLLMILNEKSTRGLLMISSTICSFIYYFM